MGIINICKCDACGNTQECKTTGEGRKDYPNGWYVLQVQCVSNGGYRLEGTVCYCNPCGRTKLPELVGVTPTP